MLDKLCNDCYYRDVCPLTEVCGYFAPITEEAENEFIEETIEQARELFHTQWNTYITKREV